MVALPGEPHVRFTDPGGVVVEVFDLTKPYAYENIFHIKMLAVGRFPTTEEIFEKPLEKMGVFKEEIEVSKEALVKHFEETTLPYLFKAGFAEKMVARRAQMRSKSKGIGGYRSERSG